MQQMAPTPIALQRVLTSMPTNFHHGNRPCNHLPKKKQHMHTSKRKDNTTNKGSKITSGSQEKWPTSGQGGYIIPAAGGVPTALERGTKLEVAHKWAAWLHNPCRLGDPHHFRARGKIGSVPKSTEMQRHPCIMGGP